MSDARQKRRLLTFSLRSLIVLVLAIGCGLGWIMHERRRIAQRREALETLGLTASPIWQATYGRHPVQPAWREWLLGDDWPEYATEVFSVGSSGSGSDARSRYLADLTDVRYLDAGGCAEIHDAGLAYLKNLRLLEELHLSGSGVTGAGLVQLGSLPNLHGLGLGRRQLTDVGIASLSQLTSLNTLYIQDFRSYDETTDSLGPLTIEGVARLRDVPHLTIVNVFVDRESPIRSDYLFGLAEATQLQELQIRDPNLNDLGFGQIARMKGLKRLTVDDAKITDAGLACLAALPALERLELENIPMITGEGLSHLADMPSLTTLSLVRVPVTDAAVQALARLKSLPELICHETHLTAEGVAELRAALPKCNIEIVAQP